MLMFIRNIILSKKVAQPVGAIVAILTCYYRRSIRLPSVRWDTKSWVIQTVVHSYSQYNTTYTYGDFLINDW